MDAPNPVKYTISSRFYFEDLYIVVRAASARRPGIDELKHLIAGREYTLQSCPKRL